MLFPTPKERRLELVDGGPKFIAKLQEPAVPGRSHVGATLGAAADVQRVFVDGDVRRRWCT